MKRILSLVLCIMLMLPCALAESVEDPVAQNAPFEDGKWVALGSGYEIYLPGDFQIEENDSFYALFGMWMDMYMSTYCMLKVTKGQAVYASLEDVHKKYARLGAEIIEVNGIRLVDQLKNLPEAQGAGVTVWELWCDDGTTLTVEFELKSDVDAVSEEIRAIFDYSYATLRKV